MNFYTRRRRSPFINIVALVDILVILLIFFVVTTTFRKIKPILLIELPKSETAKEGAAQEDPLVIAVESADKIDFGGRIIAVSELSGEVKNALARKRTMALQVDKKVPFDTVVKILDAFKQAGVDNLPAFMEKPE